MKKIAALLLVGILVGCAEEETQKEPAEVSEDIEVKTEETVEPEVVEKVEPQPEHIEPAEITFAEFDKANTRDPEETQYPDGLFQFDDGTRLNADFYQYSGGDYYDYASAIFYEGKLARLKLETTSTIADVEKGLGVTLDGVKADPTRNGFEILWDDRFSTNNIALLPSEWD